MPTSFRRYVPDMIRDQLNVLTKRGVVSGGAGTTRVHSRRVVQGSLGRSTYTISVLVYDGGV